MALTLWKLFHHACAKRQLKTSLSESFNQIVNKTLQLGLLFENLDGLIDCLYSSGTSVFPLASLITLMRIIHKLKALKRKIIHS